MSVPVCRSMYAENVCMSASKYAVDMHMTMYVGDMCRSATLYVVTVLYRMTLTGHWG